MRIILVDMNENNGMMTILSEYHFQWIFYRKGKRRVTRLVVVVVLVFAVCWLPIQVNIWQVCGRWFIYDIFVICLIYVSVLFFYFIFCSTRKENQFLLRLIFLRFATSSQVKRILYKRIVLLLCFEKRNITLFFFRIPKSEISH